MSSRVARLRRGIVFGRSDRAVRLAAIAVVAANGELVALAFGRAPIDPGWLPLALGIGILALAAFLRPIEPAPGEKFSVAAATAFFAATALPGAVAVATVWAAALCAKVVQRRSITSAAVNVAKVAGATAAASLVLEAVPLAGTLGLIAAGSAYFAVTLASAAVMVAAAQGLVAARAFLGREALPTSALLGVGGVAGLAWARDPLAILLFLPVLAAIELAMRSTARHSSATAAAEGARGSTAADAAHELRAPLAAVMSDLAYIQGSLPKSEADALASARHQVRRLSELVDRVLLVSRLDARLPAAAGADVAAAARRALEPLGYRQLVAVHLDVDEGLRVAVPEELLEVALRDLVSNALAYTREGTVRVTAGREGDRVAVVVSDTGIGIAPNELAHIFDRFYRGARAAAMAPGTGLGLAIVRRIIEGYGGRLTVRSEIDRGTQITLVLPSREGM